MMNRYQSVVYVFGQCELDLSLHELRRDGQVCAIEPQVFDLLLYLIENRDRLISKDELNEEIWQSRFVSESALSTCVKTARQAIGDNGRKQEHIRTIRQRGFRFVSPVEVLVAEIDSTEVISVQDDLNETRNFNNNSKSWRPFTALAVIALVFLIAFAIGRSSQTTFDAKVSEKPTTPSSEAPTIAVLPFQNFSDDPSQTYISDGIVEDIITDLSKVSGVLVASRHSSFSFRDQRVDTTTIAKKLNVQYLLEGSIQSIGSQLRINAQLIDARTDVHVWAERFDGERSNKVVLQNTVTLRVIEALTKALIPNAHAHRQQQPQLRPDPKSREIYHLARSISRTFVQQDVEDAFIYYGQALDLDPAFAEAYAGRAWAAATIWREGWKGTISRSAAYTAATRSARRALALDPNNALAYSALAMLRLHEGQHAEAMRLSTKALEISPSDSFYRLLYANTLLALGDRFSATSALKEAIRLETNPSPESKLVIGWIWFRLRQYENAIEALTAARREKPELNAIWVSVPLAASYAYLGREEEAEFETARIRVVWPAINATFFRAFLGFMRRSEDIEHQVEGLRLAGLPKWPFDFEEPKDNRLTGAEITNLLSGVRIRGHVLHGHYQNDLFETDIAEDGYWTSRLNEITFEGKTFVEGNLRCLQSYEMVKGNKFCAPVFRNPNGTRKALDEFISPTINGIFEFSVVRN
jgi:adenylate cyclase